jgi:hypothetical protein
LRLLDNRNHSAAAAIAQFTLPAASIGAEVLLPAVCGCSVVRLRSTCLEQQSFEALLLELDANLLLAAALGHRWGGGRWQHTRSQNYNRARGVSGGLLQLPGLQLQPGAAPLESWEFESTMM